MVAGLIGCLTVHLWGRNGFGKHVSMAHTGDNTDHLEDLEALNEEAGAVQQLRTTAHFAMKSKFLTWYMGRIELTKWSITCVPKSAAGIIQQSVRL